MKRLLMVGAMVGALFVPAGAALANDIEVGNCANGRITTVYNNNGITGETRVILCKP